MLFFVINFYFISLYSPHLLSYEMLNETIRKNESSFFVEYLNTLSKKPHLFSKDDIQFFSLKMENILNESKIF